jgi:hypothetical protein
VIEVPNFGNGQYTGFLIDPSSKNYILLQSLKLQIITSKPQLSLLWEQPYDFPIVFCNKLKNLLFVGTNDGVIRVYDVKENSPPLLIKLAVCPTSSSLFCLTPNPDIILFVKDGKGVFEMNLNSFTSQQVTQLPEAVLRIDERLIVTKEGHYLDYYTPSPSPVNAGKITLVHSEKLLEMGKKGKIVKIHKYLDL